MMQPTHFPERVARYCLAGLMASALAIAPAVAAAGEPPALSIPLVGVPGAAAATGTTESATEQLITVPAGAPGVATAEAGPIQLSTPAPAAAAPAAPAAPIAALWPLDGSRVADGAVTLSGETDSVDLALFVPPGGELSQITIAAVSSAFMLPRNSVLRIYAGEKLLGERPLESITGTEKLTFPAQLGLLKPGFNRVRVEADLVHRLYCGAEPAYDLWTKLELRQSGIAMSPTPSVGPEAFLAAAAVARGQGAPIVVRTSNGRAPTPKQLQGISRRLGRVMGGGLRFATAAPPAADSRPTPVIELRDTGTTRAVFRRGSGGEQLLDVRTKGVELPALFAEAPVADALPKLPTLSLDKPVPLSALGFRTTRIADHLWSRSIGFRLPADWLLDVKERAVLRLDFSHVADLPTGAELRIRVNGGVVRLIPLDRGRRGDAPPLEVRFDAGLLRAGRNELAVEASMPGQPADQPCIASDDPRIEIRDTSTLTVPSSPRMHMPGLGAWMSSGGGLSAGFAGAAAAGGGDLALLHELIAALDVAETGGPARQLTVLRPGDLSQAAFGELGIGRHLLLAALQQPREGRAPSADANATPALEVVQAGLFGSATAGLEARAFAALESFRRLALPDPARELAEWLDGARAQAALFQLDPASPNDAYLVLSDRADPEAVARAVGRSLRRGAPLDGHIALLGWDGAWSTWSDPMRLPVLQEPLSERNWRGVVGNFASARPRLFVGLLFGVALLSVLIANSYIAASRRVR